MPTITLKPAFGYKLHFHQTLPDQFLLHQNWVTDFIILSELVVYFNIYEIREVSFNTSNQWNATGKYFSNNAEGDSCLTNKLYLNSCVTQKTIPT